ncbi:hypothetical protein YA163_21670 [Tetragenococcus halophilus]|nr:hypothetical protein YA163_21670 [Tetragenococcus halophilus]GFK29655.1 hypothetical protein YG2_20890 [Tetragenococcus halophilus]
MGLIASLMKDPEYKDLKEYLTLGNDSEIVLFSTEGDTDPDNYKLKLESSKIQFIP